MLLTKDQMVKSLLQLVQGDYDLLTVIISEYVESMNDTQFNNMEEYINSEINELM